MSGLEVRDRAGRHLGPFSHDNFTRHGQAVGRYGRAASSNRNPWTEAEVAPIVVNKTTISTEGSGWGRCRPLLSFDARETVARIRPRVARAAGAGSLPTLANPALGRAISSSSRHRSSSTGCRRAEILRTYARHCQTESPSPGLEAAACCLPDLRTRAFATWSSRQYACDLELQRAARTGTCRTLPSSKSECLDRMGVQKESGCVTVSAFPSTVAGGGYCCGVITTIFGGRC